VMSIVEERAPYRKSWSNACVSSCKKPRNQEVMMGHIYAHDRPFFQLYIQYFPFNT
jgi:hypothetical protein